MQLKGAGILPYSIKDGQIYLLLGKEDAYDDWDQKGLYGYFSGCKEDTETIIGCALREGYEETNGILGNIESLQNKISEDNKIVTNTSVFYFFEIEYKPELIEIFKNTREYSLKVLNLLGQTHEQILKTGYFEKSEIKWFSFNEIEKNQLQFRSNVTQNLSLLKSKLVL